MNHIITYNEAIRWYKNGKLEPYEDIEEPIVKKDLFIFKSLRYYIAYYDEKYQEIFDGNEHYFINLHVFDRPREQNVSGGVIVPIKIHSNTPIIYFLMSEKGKEVSITAFHNDLPIEIKERIINI